MKITAHTHIYAPVIYKAAENAKAVNITKRLFDQALYKIYL